MGIDTTLCEGDLFTLNVFTPNATSYLWQDNSTDSILTVTEQGTFWVQVNTDNCTVTDSIDISYDLLPIIDLGIDTSLCLGDHFILNASIPNVTNYLWQDQSTDSIFNVIEQGTYWVEVTTNNCTATDSIGISYDLLPIIDLGIDTSLCRGDHFILNASIPNATSYLWQDQSTDSIFNVTEQGTYWVEVTMNNCNVVSNNIMIDFKDCNCNVYLPNIFTPNGDGKNDQYSVFSNCQLNDFHIVIFNRWGGIVYETYNYLDEWDGTYKGRNIQSGVYAFKLSYKDTEGSNKNINGTITLIR